MSGDNGDLGRVIRRMGDPSWWILAALDPVEARPGIAILERVEENLRLSGYPQTELDPSTLHYALRRMREDELVQEVGKRLVEVPGPRGSTRMEERPVYKMTGLGARALKARWQLEQRMCAEVGRLWGRMAEGAARL